jgi:osmoprotectant transport system permease protein
VTAVDVEHPPPGTETPEVSRLRLVLSDPGRLFNLVGIPIIVTIALIWLWQWASPIELSFREAQRLNQPELTMRARQHVQLTLVSTFFIVAIAVPLGVMLTRPWARRVSPIFLAIANAGQAIPSIGLMTLLAIVIGIGSRTGVIAVIAYCILPVLRNTMVGIRQVDAAIIESARGMGMTKLSVLTKIELPLAVPVMLAGVCERH